MIKIVKNFCLVLLSVFLVAACSDKEYVEYGDGGTQEITDAFLQINTPVVSFQAGTPSYEIDMNLINGSKRVSKLNIYTVYTDAKTQGKSEKVLFRSIDIPTEAKTAINETFTYGDLKSGVTVGGEALPDDELELAIGSGWVMSFEGETDQGTIGLGGTINVAVLSRFAGIYEVIQSDYYRIGVQSGIADWTGQTRFIGSVDETTFSYNDWWGPFGWTGSSFRFEIDPVTNKINVPILVNGALFSGNRALNCDTEPGIFVNVPCDGSNVLEIDDPAGNHTIKITYGYFTDGSGPREFYEVLRKI